MASMVILLKGSADVASQSVARTHDNPAAVQPQIAVLSQADVARN